MATFNKIQAFVENLAEGVFDLENDTIKVALSNVAIDSGDFNLSQITEISAGNGYTAGGNTATVSASEQSGGTYKLTLADVTFTATADSIGPFRYVYVYDDTATNDEGIGWYDYGSAVTLNDGESFTVDFDATNGVLTLA